MRSTRTMVAAASALMLLAACSGSETENQATAATNDTIAAENVSAMANALSNTAGELEMQTQESGGAGAPAKPAAPASEPARKADPIETPPARKATAETPRATPKAAPEAAPKPEPKEAAQAESKTATKAPAAAPSCTAEHRAMGHC